MPNIKPRKAGDEFERFVGEVPTSPRDGIRAMLDFFYSFRVPACDESIPDTDMILFQWGKDDLSEPHKVYLDITRQIMWVEKPDLMCLPGDELDPEMWQLSLTYKFPLDSTLNAIDSDHRWWESHEDIEKFRNFIWRNDAFRLLSERSDGDMELYFGPV